MSANSVLPPSVVTMRPLRIEYLAGTARNEASECQRRLPSAAMRRLLSRASLRPSLSRLETSAKAGSRRSSELRTVELAASSSGLKLRVKTSCCSSLMSWPGRTSTAYRSMPALIASTSAAVSGLRTSMPVKRPPIWVVRGWVSMGITVIIALPRLTGEVPRFTGRRGRPHGRSLQLHDLKFGDASTGAPPLRPCGPPPPSDWGGKAFSTQRRRDVAAVDGDHRAGCLGRLRQRQEVLRHIAARHLDAQKIASHVVGFAQPARLGALGDHFVGQKAGADAVGIDGVGADAVGAVIERVLAHQEQGRGLRESIGTEVESRIDGLLRRVEQQATAQA